MKVIGQHREKLKQAKKAEVETVKTVKSKPELSAMEKRILARNVAVKKAEDSAAVESKDASEKAASESSAGENNDALKNQMDSVEGSVDDLKADELAGSVGELSDDLDGVKDDVGSLENRVDDVENDVQKIKEKLEDDSEYIGNPELETHKVILAACKDDMLNVEDIEERKAYKAETIKKLEAFVNGYVDSAAKYPNIVAVWVMVWLFDLGDIARAVPLALHLATQIIHNMPTRFNSSIYQFICDYVYDWAVKQLEANKSAGPYLEQVIQAIESEKWQLSDIVHGKMYAIHGKHLEALGEDEGALSAFEKAMTLNERAGVKKKIERLKAKLKV
jgi:tetratricopeptide (TPR) repeat protein